MLGTTIVLCLATGVSLAGAAGRFPPHVAMLERCGGALIVVSFALLGSALPMLP